MNETGSAANGAHPDCTPVLTLYIARGGVFTSCRDSQNPVANRGLGCTKFGTQSRGERMPDRWTITCGKSVSPAPAAEASKFGGQPDWIEAPAWPIGETLGEPMTFLMQVALPESLRVG